MKVSKRELIDMVRDAYVEGYSDAIAEIGLDHVLREREARQQFQSSEIYWALRERLGLDKRAAVYGAADE